MCANFYIFKATILHPIFLIESTLKFKKSTTLGTCLKEQFVKHYVVQLGKYDINFDFFQHYLMLLFSGLLPAMMLFCFLNP